MKNLSWCTKCINNSLRPRIEFDRYGVCNACQWSEEKKKLNWNKRKYQLKKIIREIKKNNNLYDCLVPVSGGKDGTYVSNVVRDKLKLNLLTATSRPALESELGNLNLRNFIKNGFEHIHISTNGEVMQKINKLGLVHKGSPYYGWLMSIITVVVKLALTFKIKLIFYGEDGEVEYGGSSENKNKPFFDLKYAVKNYFEGDYRKILKLTKCSKKDLFWFDLSENDLKKNQILMTHWGYFEPWDSYKNYLSAKKKSGFKEDSKSNSGTFTNFAQSDQSLFALHTFIMYLKFGFGRATQDANIEIRRGAMNRDQAKNLANLYDNSFPHEYLNQYLDYYQMSKKEFFKVLDSWTNKNLFSSKKYVWIPKFKIN
tara:strand:- start:29015 stop:30124 length:1110 start_codon:yes stop_codon:yes gene_type:complete